MVISSWSQCAATVFRKEIPSKKACAMASAKILPLTPSAIGLQLQGPTSLTDNTAGQNSIRLLRLISSNDPLRKIEFWRHRLTVRVSTPQRRTALAKSRRLLSPRIFARSLSTGWPKGITHPASERQSTSWDLSKSKYKTVRLLIIVLQVLLIGTGECPPEWVLFLDFKN
jgi:hypothetical protein